MTLQRFRDLTSHLHPDSLIGLSHDEESDGQIIVIREPDSEGGETIIDCGTLDAIEGDHWSSPNEEDKS